MKKEHPLIKGTLILTITGLVTRFIGFFYRIFLSRTIGAEGMGIYQLIFPVYVMCFSLTSAGIETAISRFVASKVSVGDEKSARDILYMGLLLSLSLAMAASFVLFRYSGFISSNILDEPRADPLLLILAFAIPFCSIHSCITGYYYGLKQTSVPAFMQFMEQTVRVASVYIIAMVAIDKGISVTPEIAVYGIVFGEICSMIISIIAVTNRFHRLKLGPSRKLVQLHHMKYILSMSLPLTANRVLVNLLQSAEAILIPSMLRSYGLNTSESLSLYGVLTGMAMPLILFPSAITNSVSVMLLPTVAEAQTTNQYKRIEEIVSDTIKYCMILGILCTGGFLTFGTQLGNLMYDSPAAGKFIMTLAWICPFLYLSTTLNSILHGLGKTLIGFIDNTLGLSIRIFFVIFMIPVYGINGYLWGILVSQLTVTVLNLIVLYRNVPMSFPVGNWIVKPVFALLLSIGAANAGAGLLNAAGIPGNFFSLLLSGLIMCSAYVFLLIFTRAIHIKRH